MSHFFCSTLSLEDSCCVCRCFMTSWTSPLSMGFLRQEYWTGVGCHVLLQGDCLKKNKSKTEFQVFYIWSQLGFVPYCCHRQSEISSGNPGISDILPCSEDNPHPHPLSNPCLLGFGSSFGNIHGNKGVKK